MPRHPRRLGLPSPEPRRQRLGELVVPLPEVRSQTVSGICVFKQFQTGSNSLKQCQTVSNRSHTLDVESGRRGKVRFDLLEHVATLQAFKHPLYQAIV